MDKKIYSDVLIKRVKNIKTGKNTIVYENTDKLFEDLDKKEKLQKLKAYKDVEFCELGVDDGLVFE